MHYLLVWSFASVLPAIFPFAILRAKAEKDIQPQNLLRIITPKTAYKTTAIRSGLSGDDAAHPSRIAKASVNDACTYVHARAKSILP
jgi:hypothetical protein